MAKPSAITGHVLVGSFFSLVGFIQHWECWIKRESEIIYLQLTNLYFQCVNSAYFLCTSRCSCFRMLKVVDYIQFSST